MKCLWKQIDNDMISCMLSGEKLIYSKHLVMLNAKLKLSHSIICQIVFFREI